MDNKNHEQYLEQIEIAIAETTKDLMKKHNGDLRAMANVCAEKQVEINRLKQYQLNDRKTIKQLRGHLAEATEEIEELKEDGDEVFGNRVWNLLYEKKLCPTSYGEAVGYIKDLFEDHKKLKEEIEEQKENASYQLAGELEDINTRWAEDKEADRIEIDGLKEDLKDYKELDLAQSKLKASLTEQTTTLKAEIEFLKNQLDVGGMMNFSKYNDNDH